MPNLTLPETAAEFGLLLTSADWQVSTRVTPDAVRVEAFRDDAAVMVTHRARRQHGRRFYVLFPAGRAPSGWQQVGRQAFEHFVRHLELPPGVKGKPVRSACRCGKLRYPTDRRAAVALLDVKVRRALAGEDKAECRAYRCDDDQRTWHLTRRPRWYPAPLRPVAAATSPAGRPLLRTPHGRLSPDPSEATR